MVAVSIIGLLSAVAIPSFAAVRNKSLNKAKTSNVRLLNHAVEIWAMDTLASDSTRIGGGITNYIKGGLGQLSVGSSIVNVTNITTKTVNYTFTVEDLY